MAEIESRGFAAVSARSIAARAAVAPSAINYKFGGIEQLFRSAFEAGADQTAAWCAARREEIGVLPRGAAGAGLALEHVIAAWTSDARPLALLYQEALTASPGQGPVAAWTAIWRDFWAATATDFGLGPMDGRLMHLFFESEALYHLSTWAPALEPAAMREMCSHFAGAYLDAAAHPPTGALAAAERALGVLRDGAVAPAAVKLVEAAGAIVEEQGLSALTHRAVAARAGVTTGAVTHHFRTTENLVAGAIRGQVMAMARDPSASTRAPATDRPVNLAQMFDGMRDYLITDRPWGPSVRRRHIFLAALRRPDLAASGAIIRFAHGATTSAILAGLIDLPGEQRSLYAGVLSRLGSASWFATLADPAPRESQKAMLDEVEARLARALAG